MDTRADTPLRGLEGQTGDIRMYTRRASGECEVAEQAIGRKFHKARPNALLPHCEIEMTKS